MIFISGPAIWDIVAAVAISNGSFDESHINESVQKQYKFFNFFNLFQEARAKLKSDDQNQLRDDGGSPKPAMKSSQMCRLCWRACPMMWT